MKFLSEALILPHSRLRSRVQLAVQFSDRVTVYGYVERERWSRAEPRTMIRLNVKPFSKRRRRQLFGRNYQRPVETWSPRLVRIFCREQDNAARSGRPILPRVHPSETFTTSAAA